MRYAVVIFVLIVGFVIVPVSLLFLGIDPRGLADPVTQYFFLGMYAIPVFAALITLAVIFAHESPFQHSPLPDRGPSSLYDADAVLHSALGLMQAFVMDLARGGVANRAIYAPLILRQLDVEFAQLRQIQAQGWWYRTQFYHSHPFTADIVEEVPVSNEVVVEVQGHFDSYFEHSSGVRRGSLHPVNPVDAEPSIYELGQMRIRMQYTQHQYWVITGVSESIRGVHFGLSTT